MDYWTGVLVLLIERKYFRINMYLEIHTCINLFIYILIRGDVSTFVQQIIYKLFQGYVCILLITNFNYSFFSE